MAAAAFDTRLGKPKLVTGSAAKGIAKRLRRHGYQVVGEESFIVDEGPGPLHEGEVDRAREWGRDRSPKQPEAGFGRVAARRAAVTGLARNSRASEKRAARLVSGG